MYKQLNHICATEYHATIRSKSNLNESQKYAKHILLCNSRKGKINLQCQKEGYCLCWAGMAVGILTDCKRQEDAFCGDGNILFLDMSICNCSN